MFGYFGYCATYISWLPPPSFGFIASFACRHYGIAATFHIIDGRVDLMAVVWIFACGAGMFDVATKAVGPAVGKFDVANLGKDRCDDRFGFGWWGCCCSVGAMVSGGFGHKFAHPFFVFCVDKDFEVVHSLVGWILVTPFVEGAIKNAGVFKDSNCKSDGSGVGYRFIGAVGNSLCIGDAIP